jgi:gamma-glutamyltranspeptidase/glutathione hydrolase
MPSLSALIANHPDVEEAGVSVLADTGSALSAVVGAYFVAAGLMPGVLLAEATLLTAAVGGDVRVFDGRLRQPGLGAKRPRGFTAEDEIPATAYVAVPSAVQALLVGLAYDKSAVPSKLVRLGVKAANSSGAKQRAAALGRIAAVGAAAFAEAAIAHPLMAVAGPSQGGLLTRQDLGNSPGLDNAGKVLGRDEHGVAIGVPWELATTKAGKGAFAALSIVAVDAHGRFAALACAAALKGVEIDELQLIAPKAAVPVTRGVPRVQPGSALPGHGDVIARLGINGAPFEIEANLKAISGAKRQALRQLSSGRRRVEVISS